MATTCSRCSTVNVSSLDICHSCGWELAEPYALAASERTCVRCGAPHSEEARFCPSCGALLPGLGSAAGSETGTVQSSLLPGHEYAGVRRRFVAALLDRLIIGIPFGVMLAVAALITGDFPVTGRISWSIQAGASVVSAVYFVLMQTSTRRATLGKMALGIEVWAENRKTMDRWQALKRYLVKNAPDFFLLVPLGSAGLIALLGYIVWVLVTKASRLNQGPHDMFAGAIIMRVRH